MAKRFGVFTIFAFVLCINAVKAQEARENLVFTVNGVSFEMVYVEGGTFMMGYDSDICEKYKYWDYINIKPNHLVTLSSYYIGETEVTQALWEAVMGTTARQQFEEAQYDENAQYYDEEYVNANTDSNFPMFYVSWEDCQVFVKRLSQILDLPFRLPTEAEWEYAARGGIKSMDYKYSGGNDIDCVGWNYGSCNSDSKENKKQVLHIVKTKSPNELGIFDMTGNVDELCQDAYGNYKGKHEINPMNQYYDEKECVCRNGGTGHPDNIFMNVLYRSSIEINFRGRVVGFRIALTN